MQSTVAVVTMVRDDAFFLERWVGYYGGLFGRENCYVVNHGRGDEVARIAEGCNIFGIPGDPHPNFDMKRWRLLNNLVAGLRSYYKWVIVGDVDKAWVRKYDGYNSIETDLTIAMDHMILAAEYEGVATCWIEAYDPAKLREALGLKDHERVFSITPLGYPKPGFVKKGDKKRKPLAEIVEFL